MRLSYQPDLFTASVPRWLVCSDDPQEFGVRSLPREAALKRAYVDPNCRNLVWAMVFDIDRPGAAVAWCDAEMPRPNWVTQNPRNGHAHLGYALAAPVSRSEESRASPQRYLARIQHGMTVALEADRAYTHRLTKTPGHAKWRTLWERPEPYELDELRDYLGPRLPLRISRAEAVGEGRNVTLFDALRRWAYRARLAYGNNQRDQWDRACYMEARSLNAFACPLGDREVRQVAKSVAAWTWKNINAEAFAAVQSSRGKRSGIARASRAMDFTADLLRADRA